MLVDASGLVKNMFDLSKEAEKVVPLAYGKERSINNINNIDANRSKVKKQPFNTKVCELHGKKGHSTEECLILKKLKARGWIKKDL